MIKRRNRSGAGGARARRTLAACACAAALLAALAAAGALFAGLRGLWREQCRVEDPELDVVITTGKMVHPDVVTLHFGLTNGANLAEIPFEELRGSLLEKIPNILDIRIERRLPNRVTVEVVEREPVVRVAGPKGPHTGGTVADKNGVVFRSFNRVQLLPLIREPAAPATPPGGRLAGHALAALHLIDAAGAPEFSDLRVQEVDTSRADFLRVTLGNYATADIAWEKMGESAQAARVSLNRQLSRLARAINSGVCPRSSVWIATDWSERGGRVYAKDPTRAPR